MDGSSLARCGLREIAIESGNRFFGVIGDFVVDFEGVTIVRCFGTEKEVTIPKEIEMIGDNSFASCDIWAVEFTGESKVSSIGHYAFSWCGRLRAIVIPASVNSLGRRCFAGCRSLETVSFCAGSRLTKIQQETFAYCSALKSITLPPGVSIVDQACFCGCNLLESLVFPADSNLVGIKSAAFRGCSSLRSICLPPLIEFVDPGCFDGCATLSTFTFASPCRLRKLLDVPRFWSGLIPDSVEILGILSTIEYQDSHTLSFGRDSRLNAISARRQWGCGVLRVSLQLSSPTLKIFRSKLEFEAEM
jgi:hypothetical protein